MKFLSVCSGIEAASVAWNPLGWKAVAFSEIEPFPCAVLKHHYPDTPNWGDMTKFKEWPDVSIDLLCGGTPCQSFSVAGLRKGLDDPRGNLMLTFGAIAAKYRPKWLVWENVPGVLSSNGGRDFGSFLGMLGQLGYGFAYRIHDAQFHGVAQRRRRVFVVGCLGDWHSAAAVLFERHSLQGHPAPSREAGQEITGTLGARTTAGGGFGGDFETTGGLRAVETLCVSSHQWPAETAGTLDAHFGDKMGLENQHVNAGCPLFVPAISQYGEVAGALTARHDSSPCADRGQNIVAGAPWDARPATNDKVRGVPCSMAVRRLLPVEAEKLQGFEPGYTAIPWRKKPASECPDGPRYRALGNSWAIPVVRWIGQRIDEVDRIQRNTDKAAA